jgi:membrane protease YdiL (CAAX protease family)
MNESTFDDDDDDEIEVAAPKAEPLKPLSRNEWVELGVVFLIGVIVPFGNALQEVIWPESTQHRTSISFVQDASGTILSLGSISLLMVYLLWRSGEPWSRWGIVRFVWWRDISLAVGLWLSVWFLQDMFYVFLRRRLAIDPTSTTAWPMDPTSAWEYCLLVPMSLVIAFSEEVVVRGYLIPRLERALNSTASAVVTTSFLFASYHIYQGAASTASLFLFGLFYGAVFAWLRRLWPLVIAHALADFVAIGNIAH